MTEGESSQSPSDTLPVGNVLVDGGNQTVAELRAAEIRKGEVSAALDTLSDRKDEVEKRLAELAQQIDEVREEDTSAEEELIQAARRVSAQIASVQNIPPAERTVGALIYADKAFAGSPGEYEGAIERGLAALSVLLERLKPGEPVLIITGTSDSVFKVEVATVDKDTLVVTPPTPHVEGSNYQDGSISLTFPRAVGTRSVEAWPMDDMQVKQRPSRVAIISGERGEDLKTLESKASNTEGLVIGREAIEERLARLDSTEQLVAAAVLKASGVEFSFELEENMRFRVEEALIKLIFSLVTARSQELAGFTNWQTIHALTKVAKLDKEVLKQKVVQERRVPKATEDKVTTDEPAAIDERKLRLRLDNLLDYIYS